jgi:molybdopterin synthase catalytic subunit
MQVTVLFFGMLKDLAGRGSDALSLPEGATVSDLLAHYEAQIPRLKPYLPALATAVNQEYAARSTPLHDRDEVGLLPPVSGGATPYIGTRHVAPVHRPIDTQEIIRSIRRSEDGAIAVFEGIVRNESRGRRTLYLEYEAYEAMALAELNRLVEQALGKFKIRDACIIHRLGRLEIGETSVLIVVAAAHRAPAFDACRWLIDTLKRTVPIWKKEYFADGAVWTEGESFPENLSSPGGPPGASK